MKRNIWFTSDHHFHHESILKFTNRKFNTVEEMNQEYVRIWNSQVQQTDLVYVLGDHIWNTVSKQQYYELNSKLKGNKILITGNHDKITTFQAMNLGFIASMEEAIIKLGKTKIRLSHYPYKYGFWKALYTNVKNFLRSGKWPDQTRYHKNPENDGMWLLHGHSHQTDVVRGNMIHIGVDSWNGKLVNVQKITDLIQQNS